MKKMRLLTGTSVIALLFVGFSVPSNEVTIGNQIWMASNLNVDKFRNGDPIFEAKTPEDWEQATESKKPAWCYFGNNPGNGHVHGKLYNWYAVSDARGLAPTGWHIPTDQEWTTLITYLGDSEACKKMKSTSGWNENGNGINSVGFSGLASGWRSTRGQFGGLGDYGQWWSSSKIDEYVASYRGLTAASNYVVKDNEEQGVGFSVRCIKD